MQILLHIFYDSSAPLANDDIDKMHSVESTECGFISEKQPMYDMSISLPHSTLL